MSTILPGTTAPQIQATQDFSDSATGTVLSASVRLLEPVLQLVQHYPLVQSSVLIEGAEPEVTTRADLRQYILNCAGLTENDLIRPDARFPVSRFRQVLEALVQATGNEHIVLNLAEATQPRMLGSIGFLMTTAPHLEQAFQSLSDYFPLLFEGLDLKIRSDSDPIEMTVALSEQSMSDQAVSEPSTIVLEYFIACILNWPRWLVGYQLPAIQVSLSVSALDNKEHYQRFLASELIFDAPENSLIVQRRHFRKNCIDANAEMHQLHQEFADALLGKRQHKEALNARVRSLIRQRLIDQGDAIRREEVADILGMSLRTLQRKLGESGTHFQQIFDQTRKTLCLQLVEKESLSFGEIAFQLGFSNLSAFQKAFKRWFSMAPGAYRKQLRPPPALHPVHSSQTPEPIHQTPVQALLPQMNDRMAGFNHFCQEMMRRASVIGDQFEMAKLARHTRNPLARLVVNLWPAEQSGLIFLEHPGSDRVLFCFRDTEIRQAVYRTLTPEQCRLYHFEWGAELYLGLSEQPTVEALKTVLKHLNQGGLAVSEAYEADKTLMPLIRGWIQRLSEHLKMNTELRRYEWLVDQKAENSNPADTGKRTDNSPWSGQNGLSEDQVWLQWIRRWLFTLNVQVAEYCQKERAFSAASEFLAQARKYLYVSQGRTSKALSGECIDTSQEPGYLTDDEPLYRLLLLKEAGIQLSAGQPDQSEQCLQPLLSVAESLLTKEERLSCLLIHSRILQFRGGHQQALSLLMLRAGEYEQALPEQRNAQLPFLLSGLQQICSSENLLDKRLLQNGAEISAQYDESGLRDGLVSSPSLKVLQLQLLQQISILARQQGQPLLAACAISRMTEHCLTTEDTGVFHRFASASYAWVASWFCADFRIAEHFASLYLQLPENLTSESVRSDLIFYSQVGHWFYPVQQVREKVECLQQLTLEQGYSLKYSESSLLASQLAFFSDIPLGKQHKAVLSYVEQLEQMQQTFHKAQLQQASGELLEYLMGTRVMNEPLVYQNGWQAAARLQAVFWSDQQALWPDCYEWEGMLDNELPGYFILSEVVFCTAMMRLILSRKELQLSRRRQRVIEQQESRMEIWSQYCPDNAEGRLCLIRAEKACLLAQSPDALFEQAIKAFDRLKWPLHQALAYERYAIWLKDSGRGLLAGFCQEKALALYTRQGMALRVKQLEHDLALLAE